MGWVGSVLSIFIGIFIYKAPYIVFWIFSPEFQKSLYRIKLFVNVLDDFALACLQWIQQNNASCYTLAIATSFDYIVKHIHLYCTHPGMCTYAAHNIEMRMAGSILWKGSLPIYFYLTKPGDQTVTFGQLWWTCIIYTWCLPGSQ